MLIIGLSYYARGKGYSAWFGILAGLLSWVGIIFLAVLKDKNIESIEQNVIDNDNKQEKKAVLKVLFIITLIIGIPLIILIILIAIINFSK